MVRGEDEILYYVHRYKIEKRLERNTKHKFFGDMGYTEWKEV